MSENRKSFKIADITVWIADIPLVRPHRLAMATITAQSNVVVRVRDGEGREGWGEAASIPHYGAESAETIACVIRDVLAPALIGTEITALRALVQKMDQIIKANPYAKSAVELAMADLMARARDMSLAEFFGGALRTEIPSLLVLGTGEAKADAAEAKRVLDAKQFRIFLLKIGKASPAEDVARVRAVADTLPPEADLRVDVNQKWDYATARKFAPALFEAGVSVIEQPLPREDVAGMAELVAHLPGRIMADEPVETLSDAMRFIAARACSAVSLKVCKHGGATRTLDIAAAFTAAGIPIFGGTMLESSLGAAAHLQIFSAFEQITMGQQLFAPRLMKAEYVKTPLRYENFALHLPEGPGTGMAVDADILSDMARK